MIYKIAERENFESIWGVSSYGRKKAADFFLKVGMDDPVQGFRKIYIDESVVL